MASGDHRRRRRRRCLEVHCEARSRRWRTTVWSPAGQYGDWRDAGEFASVRGVARYAADVTAAVVVVPHDRDVPWVVTHALPALTTGFPALRTLDLRMRCGAARANAVVDVLPRFPRLERLILLGDDPQGLWATAIARAAPACRLLRQVHLLSDRGAQLAVADAFARACAAGPSVERVDVNCAPVRSYVVPVRPLHHMVCAGLGAAADHPLARLVRRDGDNALLHAVAEYLGAARHDPSWWWRGNEGSEW